MNTTASKIAIYAVLCILLTGCSTAHVEKKLRPNPATESAVLVGSISYTGSPSLYKIGFKEVKNGNIHWIEVGKAEALSELLTKYDLKNHGIKGNIFGLELSPGHYKFDRWIIRGGTAEITNPKDFNIEIEITAGKSFYIGNFNFKQTKSYGLSVAGANLILSNQYDRDAQEISKKYPLLGKLLIPTNIKIDHSIEFTNNLTFKISYE
jgi:hypothetical protein